MKKDTKRTWYKGPLQQYLQENMAGQKQFSIVLIGYSTEDILTHWLLRRSSWLVKISTSGDSPSRNYAASILWNTLTRCAPSTRKEMRILTTFFSGTTLQVRNYKMCTLKCLEKWLCQHHSHLVLRNVLADTYTRE